MAFRLTRYKDWLPPLLKKLFAVHGVKTSQERGAVPLEDLPLPRPAIVWNEPWFQIEDAAHQSGLQRELHAEIGPQHPLWGKYPIVFGRSRANDDIAVCLADATFAIVHLVWSGRIDSLPGIFPVTTVCHDLAELQACMDERLDSEENETEDGGDPHSYDPRERACEITRMSGYVGSFPVKWFPPEAARRLTLICESGKSSGVSGLELDEDSLFGLFDIEGTPLATFADSYFGNSGGTEDKSIDEVLVLESEQLVIVRYGSGDEERIRFQAQPAHGFEPTPFNGEIRFVVTDVMTIVGRSIVAIGDLEAGSIRLRESLVVHGKNRGDGVRVLGIAVFPKRSLAKIDAPAHQVHLEIAGVERGQIQPGDVITNR